MAIMSEEHFYIKIFQGWRLQRNESHWEEIGKITVIQSFMIYFPSLPGEQLQQGEDLAAAVNAAASEQNYEAE